LSICNGGILRERTDMAETYDLVVIGTGVATSKIAETCRRAGWRIAVVDRRPYGGTCRLRGCDPKKLLWGVAETVEQAKRFAHDGFAARSIALSWPDLIRFKRSFLASAPEAVEQEFRNSGIETLHGRAHFVGPSKLAVDGHDLQARHFAITSGSTPARLPIPGADHLLTSDDFMELEELPDPLIFVGGGYISFEFAHIAVRAGAKVTILHQDDRPLAHFDRDLVNRLLDKSRRVGIDIRLDSRVEGIESGEQGVKVWARSHGVNHPFEAAAAIHGAGRVPDIDDLDLTAGCIEREDRRLRLNQGLQSVSNPAVYAAGDAAAAGPMLTPVSELDAEVVGANLLEGAPRRAPTTMAFPASSSPSRPSPRLASQRSRRSPNICDSVMRRSTSGTGTPPGG
jgi:glutathione reductase (NADPH)